MKKKRVKRDSGFGDNFTQAGDLLAILDSVNALEYAVTWSSPGLTIFFVNSFYMVISQDIAQGIALDVFLGDETGSVIFSKITETGLRLFVSEGEEWVERNLQ